MPLNFFKYKENMNSEFSTKTPHILSVKALKLDSKVNSMKEKLAMQNLKSCDYISFRGHKTLSLIEFTDLARQSSNLDGVLSNLSDKKCLLDKSRKCNKAEANKARKAFNERKEILILNELRQKCTETTLLIHNIADHKRFYLKERFREKRYLIIVPEKDLRISAIVFEQLNRNLKTSLNGVVDTVKIISSAKLEKLIKN